MSVGAWRTAAPARGWRIGRPVDATGRRAHLVPTGSVEHLHLPLQVLHKPVNDVTVRLALAPRTAVPLEEDWRRVPWDEAEARFFLTGQAPPGEYLLWVEITSYPERITRAAGLLTLRPGPAYAGPVAPPPPRPGFLGPFLSAYLGTPYDPDSIPGG